MVCVFKLCTHAQSMTSYNYTIHVVNGLTGCHLCPPFQVTHRIKRTVFIEDRPEVTHSKMMDLPVSFCSMCLEDTKTLR